LHANSRRKGKEEDRGCARCCATVANTWKPQTTRRSPASLETTSLWEHPAIAPTDEQVGEIVTTRAYDFEYVLVYASDTAFEEEFGPDPY
jgi:hypothetical protein